MMQLVPSYRRKFFLGFTLLVIILTACSGQAETPTPAPAEPTETAVPTQTAAPTIAPTIVPTDTPEPVITNAVTVADQPLSADNTVTIAHITSDMPGWIVIHAEADGKPGPVIGHAPITMGDSSDVAVEIDASAATTTLYAMLHVDAGTVGEYEFPGEDVPATAADGSMVTPPFAITGGLSAATMIMLVENETLGPILVDAAGMTLYTFANDTPGTSNCYDQCAVAWPPLLVDADADLAAGVDIPGTLDTTERTDGTQQVTYDGYPLYYWVNDTAPGDTTGQNVRNVWAVARPTTTVLLGGNDELGRFLTGPEGLTLYRFNPDEPGLSSCYDQCALNWPPLLVADGEVPYGGAGLVGELGTTVRDDDTIQVTYNGMPLYYWLKDENPGDATGEGVNDVWFIVRPYTVRVGNNDDLGDFLVADNGMTLYIFTNDTENQSSCYDQCATNWPPLLVNEGEIPGAGDGITGELGTTLRDDGTFQVTYNGQPLYFWIKDEAPGDTTGQNVNDVWFVVAP